MSQPVDISVLTNTRVEDSPWTRPPLRKLANEIHDNATQMMILGKIMLDLGDLMERHMKTIERAIQAEEELTRTIKETLG